MEKFLSGFSIFTTIVLLIKKMKFMKNKKHFIIVLVYLVSPLLIFSQTCCSGGVPLGGSFGLGTAEQNSLQFLLTYDYNALNTLVDISTKFDDKTRSRITQSTILEINYGINQRFTLTGLIPIIYQERKIQTFDASIDVTSTRGLGDMVLLLKYRMLDKIKYPNLEWVIGGGFKFPNGKTDHTNNIGLILPADMQSGSGSLDFLYWMFFQKNNFIFPKLSLLSVTTYRLNGTNKNYNHSQEFKFGNELQFSLGLNYNFYAKWLIDIFSFVRYRNQDIDLIDGNMFPSSGGQWVYFIPGASIKFSSKLSLRLSGDIPIYLKLKGLQLTTSYKFSAALLFNINTKKIVSPFKN